MKKFVPYEKMTKRQKKEFNKKKRGTWGAINPVTRKPENPKAYKRKKALNLKDEPDSVLFILSQPKL